MIKNINDEYEMFWYINLNWQSFCKFSAPFSMWILN